VGHSSERHHKMNNRPITGTNAEQSPVMNIF